jgi:hypothetical protein
VRQPSARPNSVRAECTEAVAGGMLTESSKRSGPDKVNCPMINQHPVRRCYRGHAL